MFKIVHYKKIQDLNGVENTTNPEIEILGYVENEEKGKQILKSWGVNSHSDCLVNVYPYEESCPDSIDGYTFQNADGTWEVLAIEPLVTELKPKKPEFLENHFVQYNDEDVDVTLGASPWERWLTLAQALIEKGYYGFVGGGIDPQPVSSSYDESQGFLISRYDYTDLFDSGLNFSDYPIGYRETENGLEVAIWSGGGLDLLGKADKNGVTKY